MPLGAGGLEESSPPAALPHALLWACLSAELDAHIGDPRRQSSQAPDFGSVRYGGIFILIGGRFYFPMSNTLAFVVAHLTPALE